MSAIQDEFASAQAAEIVDKRRRKFGHVAVRAATLDAGNRLDQDPQQEPFRDWRRRQSEPCTVTLAFDGGYARRTRKGPRRNFEILTGASDIDGQIWVFAIC